MDQYIGKMLDNRYEILERIGTGGMAVVYKAKCHRLNRLVAVKILKADLAQDEDFRRRFNAESQAVAQLSHPNIVSVYDVSRGGDTEYIVMELIDGITLKQYMEKRGQLNWRESLHFIIQIMRGLSHAHSRGIVHRDIKPQNIMVLRDGSVKVADFGIACLENSAQTLTQEALGSVHYISPEQARGDRIDARSDIYSAGVVLYEMLTGRLPFEGDSAVSVAIQHLSSIPLAPREINPDIPEQLELICMKAMASDIDRRYASADDMIADLEAFRKNPGVNLDFELEDLRPEEVDEPTRLLRTGGAHAASATQTAHRPAPAHERERRRDYDDDYDERKPQRKNGTRTVLTVVAVVLAVALVAVMFKSILGSFGSSASETYRVPSVLGYPEEEAKEKDGIKDIFQLKYMGDISSDYPEGTIAKQDPAEGEYRKGDNLVIQIWISSGEDTSVMLDVTKQTFAQAKQTMKNLIEKYDLVFEAPPEEEWVYNDEIEKGCIVSTEPAVNEQLKKGDTIKIVMSKGPQTSPLLPFEGVQLEVARKQLTQLGLDIGDVTYETSEYEAGIILRQDPAANTAVASGTKVNFVVSSGPENTGNEGWTAGEDTLYIPLPEDRETARLVVYQDGNLLLDKTVDCTLGNYPVTVTGTGETHIYAELDGEVVYDKTITVEPYYD